MLRKVSENYKPIKWLAYEQSAVFKKQDFERWIRTSGVQIIQSLGLVHLLCFK